MMPNDSLQIRDIIDRYSLGVTLHDKALIASVFMPDGRWSVAAPFNVEISGAQAIAAAIFESTSTMDVIVQMVHSVVIDLDGDEAHVRSIVHEVARAADGATGMSMYGIYDDKAVRSNGKWLFAHRSFKPLFLNDTPPIGQAL